MRSLRNITLGCLCAVALYTALPTAYAASINASTRNGYGRVSFGFDAPATLKTSASGTSATLTFDKPVTASTASIQSSLPDYVTSATLSADKRTLTLSLAKPVRLRHFTSGNTVGVDLIATGDTRTTTAENPTKPEDPILTTKKETPKPAPEKPAAKSPKAIVEAKQAAKASTTMLSTKKAEPAAKKAAPTTPAPSQEMLSTKKEPAPATVAAKPEPEPDTMLSTKTEEPKPTVAEPAPPKTEAMLTPKAPAAEAKAAPTASKGPFLVTTKTAKNGETTINFPWRERTAAAAFRSANDIWIVFSRPVDVNAGLLRTILPRKIISLTQYAHEGNTVLRLVTDGTLNVNARQTPQNYSWDISLAPTTDRPLQEVPFTTDRLSGSMRMVLGVFDVSPELRFYDPNSGEALIIIPSYENGRGVGNERSFPEFKVLASSQGVALVDRQSDLKLSQTRSGLVVSGENGLAVSENLPLVAGTAPVVASNVTSSVMMPYDQWFIPHRTFQDVLMERLAAIDNSTKATLPNSMLEVVKLYLTEGMGAEAYGMLAQIKQQFPDYYVSNSLALLSAAANVMNYRMDTAAADLLAPELAELEEAQLWRQVVALYAPQVNTLTQMQGAQLTPTATDADANTEQSPAPAAAPTPPPPAAAPVFQYLKFNKPYIRYYPPRIRQRLATIAADAYIADEQEEKAVALYDALSRDGILGPVRLDAEFALGATAQKKGENDQALEIFDRLSKEPRDRYITARARTAATLLRYSQGKITADEAAETLERIRLTWRGDALERKILTSLIDIYKEGKKYDGVLHSMRALIDAFPNDPNALVISGEMAQFFEGIFLGDEAPEMTPLQATSLFEEFRELTPMGEKGDQIVQKLADQISAMDLLDRAIQLLQHQLKYRATGEVRAKVGARLALLHLLNKNPEEALSALEISNFGSSPAELQTLRRELAAQALTTMGKHEEALGVIFSDNTPAGNSLRLNILWSMKDWPNVVNRAEDILSARPNLTEPLSPAETETLLKLALAYCFEGDYTQLRYLRDYYSALIPDSAYKQIFDFMTNDTNPLDPEDFAMLAQQISRTESFLDTFKAKIAAGKLSEAVQ